MADDDTTSADSTTDGGAGDGTHDGDGLTDAGRQAIQRERDAAKKAQDQARPWRALAKKLGATSPEDVERLLAEKDQVASTATQRAESVDVERVKREARAEALAEVNTRLVRSRVRELAAGSFADPSDALAFVDLESIDVDDDGEVDAGTVERELKAVLKAKPHLGKRSKQVDFDGGARTTAEAPKDMNSFLHGAVLTQRGIRR